MPMQHWAHSIQSAFGTHNSTLAVIVTRSLAARLGQWSCFRFAMCVGGVGGNASWQETARAHFRGMLFPKIKAFLRRQLGPTRFYVALSSRFQEAALEEDSGEKAWLAKMLLGAEQMLQGPHLGLELIRGLGLGLQSDCGWVLGMLGRKGLPYMYFVLYGRHMEKLIFKKRCVHTHVTYLYMVDFHSRVGLLEGTLCKRPCQFSK